MNGSEARPPGGVASVADDPRFAELRKSYRGFVFPVTAAFLAWYLAYVACSAYARGFMAHKLFGNINVALVFGLLQFVSTFGIALAYGRYANRRLDPIAQQLRDSVPSDNISVANGGTGTATGGTTGPAAVETVETVDLSETIDAADTTAPTVTGDPSDTTTAVIEDLTEEDQA